MATKGQQLTAPEAGWKRIDDTNENISYMGNWTVSTADTNWYNNTVHLTNSVDSIVQFNFTGSKFRIVGTTYLDHATQMDVEIDGVVVGSYSQYSPAPVNKNILLFEAEGLSEGEHRVRILSILKGTIYALAWDIIDISETGELKPYSDEKALLVIEMSDGLQKEYELTKSELDDFIAWYNTRAGGTGDPCYIFNKSFNKGPFDSRKDYLVFDKIQNFEVMKYTK